MSLSSTAKGGIMQTVEIIPATPQNASAAAELIFLAYHKYSYDIFGNIGQDAAIGRFKQLWIRKNNRFSYQHSFVATLNGKTVGLITCYKAQSIKKLVYPTLWQLFCIGKLQFICHLLANLNNFYYFSKTSDILPNELYIATLAVSPEHRRKGIATELLNRARQLAKYEGLTCTLHVSAENKRAVALYETTGFMKKLSTSKSYYKMIDGCIHVTT